MTRHFILAGVGADTIDPDARLTYTNEVVAGIDREIMPNTTLGVRYVYRNMPRVLEDIANCPMVAYELAATSSICGSVEYILTNPSSDIPVAPGTEFLGAKFDDPIHKYNSVELTLNRRGSNWSAMTSYRFSTLRGNFEGFYRDDNGQSDPGISSLYDFPTNDPSYASIGGTVYGYPGDIRYLGSNNGILPLDRPHQIKLYGNRTWSSGLNIGGGINLSSGKPLTPMAANPNYGSSGEIPEAARGTGIDTIDGFTKRTPFESQIDMQAAYTLRASSQRRVTLLADVFNLFNQRRVTSVRSEHAAGQRTGESGLRKAHQHDLRGQSAAVPVAVQHARRRAVRVLVSFVERIRRAPSGPFFSNVLSGRAASWPARKRARAEIFDIFGSDIQFAGFHAHNCVGFHTGQPRPSTITDSFVTR